ncbi:MAG: HEAT repeat domain-containing protein [Spirochaetes bacterium]|nr:HEAT repeat domain-containing protein [Spirochaetota bacterium]
MGRELLHRALMSDATAFFIFRPAGEFFSVYSLINSPSELKRLSGYYSLMEYGHRDDAFLMERFSLERSPAVRRTIVWMLGFSEGSEQVTKFLMDAYPGSSGAVRDQILQSLSSVSPRHYRDFVKKNSIKNDLQGR